MSSESSIPAKPVAIRVLPAGIPAELRARDQWVLWRYVFRKTKWTKPPFQIDGSAADSTSPPTWASFEAVWNAYGAGGWDGLGYVHRPEDNLVGGDADHCRDPQTGAITGDAAAALLKLDSYTEISPSGRGIRSYAFGRKPGRSCKQGAFELYDGVTRDGKPGGRFLTLTGHHLDISPATINARQEAIDRVYYKFWPKAEPATTRAGPQANVRLHLSDEDVLERAYASKQGPKLRALMNGDTSGFSSHSEADQALANILAWWFRKDEGRVDRVFRASKLFREDKWGRDSYRKPTIRKAVESVTDDGYDPLRNVRVFIGTTLVGSTNAGEQQSSNDCTAEIPQDGCQNEGSASEKVCSEHTSAPHQSAVAEAGDDGERESDTTETPASDPSGDEQGYGETPPPAQDEEAHVYPAPKSGETWDDPHRLARFYDSNRQTAEGESTLRQWREEFHRWHGAAWRPIPDSDLDAELAKHCREVFQADYPFRLAGFMSAQAAAKSKSGEGKNEKPKKPALFKVTAAVKTNTKLNLAGLVNLPDSGVDAPFWRNHREGLPDAADVIAAPNGLFTLADIAMDKGPFSPPTPQFFTGNALPFPVMCDPPLPTLWLRCLDEWFGKDAATILGAQELLGYLLSSHTCAHKIALLIGQKRSGKGTFIRILNALVGASNIASTSFAALSENFGLEDLLGKQVAVIPDARLSNRPDLGAVVERLLSISGEDSQTVNRKNRRRITTRLKARFLIATNEIPALLDSSGALASRFFILVMPNSFYGKEDKQLEQKLLCELPGILAWAAKGFVRFRTQGFTFTKNNAAECYHRELEDLSSPTRAFVRERCRTGATEEVLVKDLFDAWCDWNEVRNSLPGNQQMFGRNLHAACPHVRLSQPRQKDGNRIRIYCGIGLRPRNEWGDDDDEGSRVARDGTRSKCSHAKDEDGLFAAA